MKSIIFRLTDVKGDNNMTYNVWQLPQPAGSFLPGVTGGLIFPLGSRGDLASMPIVWNGTAFSGKIEIPKTAVHTISGQVSTDGNTLLSMDYTYSTANSAKGSSKYSRRISKISLANMPILNYPGFGNVLTTNFKGTDVNKYVTKIEDQLDQYYTDGDQKWETRVYVSTDWANTMFSFSFSNTLDPWISGGLGGTFTVIP
jgi:hypothetical protein